MPPTEPWPIPRTHPPLSDEEIHVWRAPLQIPPSEQLKVQGFLAEQERERANRFQFPQHQQHFIAARGILRMLLAHYLQQPPRQIQLQYNQYGKPSLALSDPLRFNLSHSGEMALYAFSRNRELGVDIEWTQRRLEDEEQIAKRFFSTREADTLLRLPAPVRKTAFFDCWTRKEAYIKAYGKGLSIPLNQFEVTLVPGEVARLQTITGDPTHWTIQPLTPGDKYTAALVVEGAGWEVKCWTVDFPSHPSRNWEAQKKS